MLHCMKRINKQTNEYGNDRAWCVDMKMKIKFVRNNNFEEETDLNEYIFPFLDNHHSLFNRAKLRKFTFIFRIYIYIWFPVSGDSASWINKWNSFWWWTKSIWLLFKNMNSVPILVLNKKWRGKVQWNTFCVTRIFTKLVRLLLPCVTFYEIPNIIQQNAHHIVVDGANTLNTYRNASFHKWFFYFQWWRNNVDAKNHNHLPLDVSMWRAQDSRLKLYSRCTNSLQLGQLEWWFADVLIY